MTKSEDQSLFQHVKRNMQDLLFFIYSIILLLVTITAIFKMLVVLIPIMAFLLSAQFIFTFLEQRRSQNFLTYTQVDL
ncbi:hypothetical protein Ciccas_013619 [Cichlidogyrus casuarinus]|uniref:Uncharacterized protein n=1 Tax=Cichlidogyrus casuarinus TaxID=1844966 RepID=A0ABD2PMF8_9PLAT